MIIVIIINEVHPSMFFSSTWMKFMNYPSIMWLGRLPRSFLEIFVNICESFKDIFKHLGLTWNILKYFSLNYVLNSI
jgi:hypothetical protein